MTEDKESALRGCPFAAGFAFDFRFSCDTQCMAWVRTESGGGYCIRLEREREQQVFYQEMNRRTHAGED